MGAVSIDVKDKRELDVIFFKMWIENIYNIQGYSKALRGFRTRLRNNQDRHSRKEHINR